MGVRGVSEPGGDCGAEEALSGATGPQDDLVASVVPIL